MRNIDLLVQNIKNEDFKNLEMDGRTLLKYFSSILMFKHDEWKCLKFYNLNIFCGEMIRLYNFSSRFIRLWVMQF